jgi:Putative adhesin
VNLSLISVLLTAPLTLFGAATTPDTFHWSGNVPAGQQIEIRGINGNIHAQPAHGDSVDVIAYKSGRAIDPGTIGVKVLEHDGGVTIVAVPGTSSPAAGDANIDFTVSVPSGVRFVARTVNGLVEAKSLDADAEAHTVNGDVVLSTSGTAQGETVNGSITASVGKISSALKFSTVNGAISLEVPRGASARIRARTKNGPIRSDFHLAVHGEFPAQHAEGVIGCGGPELQIATVNGSISVRRNKRFTKL